MENDWIIKRWSLFFISCGQKDISMMGCETMIYLSRAFSKRCRAFLKSWRGFAQLCKSFLKMLESGFQYPFVPSKKRLDEFEKRLDEFVKMSRRVFPFVLIGITWHYLPEAALYSKFDKNKCHVSNGLCANALWWTHPYFFAFTSRSALWNVSERKDSPAFIVSSCFSISMKHETTFSLIYMRGTIYTWKYVFQPFTPFTKAIISYKNSPFHRKGE